MRLELWVASAATISLNGLALASETPVVPIDTGLGQQLRQQVGSACYGFVDHDPGLIRGFEVSGTRQLQRDGYPWAHFEGGSNLLIEREDVLVGGAGAACSSIPPGGAVNLITRRDALPTRTVIGIGQHGGLNVLHETGLVKTERLGVRVALRADHLRNPAHATGRLGEAATQIDWQLTEAGHLRFDLEWLRANYPWGVAWPAWDSMPAQFDARRSLDPVWSRYRVRQLGTLLAYEHTVSADTQVRVGWSRVRAAYEANDVYLSPTADPGRFDVTAYAVPLQRDRFDALHADVEHRFDAFGVKQRWNVGASRLTVSTPDSAYPAQELGEWSPGEPLDAPQPLPAEASRRLTSREARLTVRHVAQLGDWHTQLGAVASRYEDSNGSASLRSDAVSPQGSVAWQFAPQWRVQATRSRGTTARQYASLTSDTPERIAAPGRSDEQEVGLRWTGRGWSAGGGLFELTKPYRYQRETVTVWRGRERHRGAEATLSWTRADDAARIVFTTQVLDTEVSGTGDPALDGMKPPGVPSRRGSLYAEAPWPGAPAWTLSLLGEAVSRRPTFDDNRVYAPGHARWDAGLQWRGSLAQTAVAVLFTVQNVGGREGWEDVGGGVGHPMLPRRVGLTLTLGGA